MNLLNSSKELKESKKKFDKLLKHFDVPHVRMNSNTYLINESFVVQLLGDPAKLIGLEEE